MRCKGCGCRSTILSNACLRTERIRLKTGNGLLGGGCKDSVCINHLRPLARSPNAYRMHGFTPIGRPRFTCLMCGQTFVLGGDRRPLHRLGTAAAASAAPTG